MRRALLAVVFTLSLSACQPYGPLVPFLLGRPSVTQLPAVPPAPAPPTTVLIESVGGPDLAKTAMDEALEALAWCESTNTNDLGGPYWGYLQFATSTWESVTGLPGPASDYSREQQFEAAAKLASETGFGSWPGCAAELGLA